MTERLRVVLTLEDADTPSRDGWPRAPATVRLRRLLKALLRAYSFRCLSVEEVTPAGRAEPQADGAGGTGVGK